MRQQLNARGAKTIRGLGRTFRHFDSVDGNRKCDANEFFTGLQDIGVNVSKGECDVSYLYARVWLQICQWRIYGDSKSESNRIQNAFNVPNPVYSAV